MNSDEFKSVIDKQFSRCKELLAVKASEYATEASALTTEDRLHNFRVAAELQGVTLEKALGGMMAKHTVSLYDLIEKETSPWANIWDEKLDDHLNYLLLLRAVLEDAKKKDTVLTDITPSEGDIHG